MSSVLVLHNGINAVDYHRLIIPFNAIDRATNITFYQAPHLEKFKDMQGEIHEALTPQDLMNLNIRAVVYNRNLSPTFNPMPTIAMLKAIGIKVIIDIDDYWEVKKGHYLDETQRKLNLSRCITDQIMVADYVITTHSELRKEIGKIRPTKNVIIAPNGIDPTQPQFSHEGLTYDYEHLYWQGGVSHNNDIKELGGAFDGLLDYKFTMDGYSEHPPGVWSEMLEPFKYVNLDYNYGRPIDTYAVGYRNKGICLIPLQNNKFNRLKSELKAIEAGYFQKTVIASHVHPYTRIIEHDVNGLLVHKKPEWNIKIKGLLSNRQWQDDLRFKLHETVMKKYLIDKVNESRIDLLNSIL